MICTPLPLLYSYRRCPYAMRARMALLVAGMAFDAHDIVLRDKPAALLALSPKGTVPVLVLPDGTVLEQSLDIMQWAFQQRDPEGWWARAQSPQNLALLSVCDGAFKHQLDRYKYPERFDGVGHRARPRDAAVEALLVPLDARLQRHGQLGGATPCATDLALFPFVRQFAAVEPGWFASLPLPALQAWLAGWLAHPLFEAAMVKLPSGQTVRFAAWSPAGGA
ncbi:MAG: glutathione S-transferase [Hydrogenophaga sp.]|jgi:glutathione S-transferase|uniref:glutathione S-transferase n=1 Tax=Hydrogenophaga sp. TaxID=1904254 RepID=UPI001D28AB39|nr:glutathione S-transferase [Hydrogenophaga sp.]MBW0168652.1 glutathione S-transferase [Hydrogenophaga sp.]MBW0182799.1 glutathione S-transferase [Hydrogenophaga sp.]